MIKSINKTILSFKTVSIFAIFLSLTLNFLCVIRFLHRYYPLNFLPETIPETIPEILDKSPIWFFYIYTLIAITILIASILLYRKNIISVTLSNYAAAIMLLLITSYFFSTNYISFYVALELVVSLLFYLFLAWFSRYANNRGYLSKFSKEVTTVSLKIQEGCDHECSYCPIPSKKGSSKSDTLKNIIANVEAMADEGIKDIVLTGDNVGDFGTGEKGNLTHLHGFFDLIKELDEIGGIHRFSFLSITTPMISDKTLNFIKKSNRFSPDFSIKMDSGSDNMLKIMNRPYSLKQYKDLYLDIKKIIPEAFIDVEIIVGFPGETDELFNETVEFLSEEDISHITPSIYSEKIGSKAFGIKKGIVSKNTQKKRKKILSELSKEKLKFFYKNQLGSEKIVLFENRRRGDFIYGYTENHIKVKAAWNPKLGNTVHKIRLTGINRSVMSFDFIKDERRSNSFVFI
jgi:MiaB/RimO family radical SAM methylthiotransferase